MAKVATKSRLAAPGEELGEQLLQSVREMKAGLRGRVHMQGAPWSVAPQPPTPEAAGQSAAST